MGTVTCREVFSGVGTVPCREVLVEWGLSLVERFSVKRIGYCL